MIERVDDKWFKGKYIFFKDEGKINPTAKTKKYTIISRIGQQVLGHVKWYIPWRQYVFAPLGGIIMDKTCMLEMAEFVEGVTKYHRDVAKLRSLKKKYPNKKFTELENQLVEAVW